MIFISNKGTLFIHIYCYVDIKYQFLSFRIFANFLNQCFLNPLQIFLSEVSFGIPSIQC